jgi:uncharacterized alkaline shock family protein YloU
VRGAGRPDSAAGRAAPIGAGTLGAGTLRVADRVVEKIAAAAAAEVPGVAGPSRRSAPRLLPRAGAGRFGRARPVRHRSRGMSGRRGYARRPLVSANVQGSAARLTMAISVRYPSPVEETAGRVRALVRERVAALAGIRVIHLDIEVPALRLGADLPRSDLDDARQRDTNTVEANTVEAGVAAADRVVGRSGDEPQR